LFRLKNLFCATGKNFRDNGTKRGGFRRGDAVGPIGPQYYGWRRGDLAVLLDHPREGSLPQLTSGAEPVPVGRIRPPLGSHSFLGPQRSRSR
jgi:hypothetical protein